MILAGAGLFLAWQQGALPTWSTVAGQVASLRAPEPAPAVPASEPAPVAATAAANAAPEPAQAPSFDVVRVEPDGSALVAGRAAPQEAVTVRSGDTVVAQGQADANGEFVFDFALPAGQHRLALDGAQAPGGALVNVPARGDARDLMVMLERPGEASQLLVRPAAATPAPVPPAVGALSVEAVEIENRQLFVAGSATAGAPVQLYLDDKAIARTQGGEGGRFVASVTTDVPVGERRVRADQLGPDGAVVARVEVPFDRTEGDRMAAVAAPPASGASPADAPSGAQAALEPSDPRVIIRRGDTLWRISRDLYGRGSRYTVIYLANGDQIRDPDRIYPGQVFRTPGEDAAPRG